MREEPFRDQVVIVTGASSGIGRAVALELAGQGARVALAARDAERLEQVAALCRERGGDGLAVPTDVGQEAACRKLVERTIGHYGRLDMLVTNAAINALNKLADMPDLTLFKSVMDVNFWGMVYCAYYALPHLTQTNGRIVCVSSLAGHVPLPYSSPYVSSKHAVQGFFDTLRIETSRSGVSVTVVSPYWVVTEFHERQLGLDGKPAGEAGRKIYSERMMTAEQCARLIVKAAARRKREVLMGPSALLKMTRLIAPSLLDKMIVGTLKRAVQRQRGTSEGNS